MLLLKAAWLCGEADELILPAAMKPPYQLKIHGDVLDAAYIPILVRRGLLRYACVGGDSPERLFFNMAPSAVIRTTLDRN